MRRIFVGLLLFVLSALSACGESHQPGTTINAVVGDASWHALRSSEPANASESERIRVHLEWVESELRRVDLSTMDAAKANRRMRMLDVLSDYREAGSFPRHTASVADGRAPRWVDDRGVHCAVAHLVAASGRADLVEAVQRRHEYDYVPDIDVPELAAWADEYGFSAQELAMIQPTYDDGGVHIPTRAEEEEARRRAEAEAKIPRPLDREVLERALSWYVNRDHKRECFGQRTGRWKFEAKVAVGGDVVPVVRVDVTDSATGERDEKLSRCWRERLRLTAKNQLSQKNYTVKGEMTAKKEQSVFIPTRREVVEAFFAHDVWASHHSKSRLGGLAECTKEWPDQMLPLRVRVSVSSWNGQITVAYPEIDMPEGGFLHLPNETQRRLHCVGDILRYGRLQTHPLHDLSFDVTLQRDGGMSLVKRNAP